MLHLPVGCSYPLVHLSIRESHVRSGVGEHTGGRELGLPLHFKDVKMYITFYGHISKPTADTAVALPRCQPWSRIC